MNITTRDLIMNKTKSRTKLKEHKSNHTYIAIIVGLQNPQIGGYTIKKTRNTKRMRKRRYNP